MLGTGLEASFSRSSKRPAKKAAPRIASLPTRLQRTTGPSPQAAVGKGRGTAARIFRNGRGRENLP